MSNIGQLKQPATLYICSTKIRFISKKPFFTSRQGALYYAFNQSLLLTGTCSTIIVNQSNLGNSCGLYSFFSSITNTGSLIFIEPGTIRGADVSPLRSDISWYAPLFFPLRFDDFHCFWLRHPMNFNCFFRHFDCVNTQICSLIRVLLSPLNTVQIMNLD